ncbi:MAG: outer membrane beta-barrel protein [Sulfuriferula sp.]
MHKFNKSVLALALVCVTAPVLADDASSATPAPATAPNSAAAIATAPPMVMPNLSQMLAASNVMVMGYLDAGYTNMDSTGLFTNGSPSRVFDAPGAAAGHNFSSFNLNQAALTVAMQPKEGFGGLVNITAGQDASTIASYGEGAGSQHNFDLTQAFGSYATGPLTVIAGKFVTLAGAEVIASPSDTNYSRSILFGYAIPFTHTGVRATYAVSDTLSLIGGINNGWDQVSSLNGDQTAELGVTATPIKMLALSAVYYGGNELTSTPLLTPGAANGMRNLYDFVATLTATSQLSFVFNYDYATQANAPLSASLPNGPLGTATWDGWAAYVNYQFNDQWRLSARGEYFNDQNGFRTGIAQKWKEGTLTLAYIPTTHVELRAELRQDQSNVASFLNSSGFGKDSQTSEGLEALYKF